MVKGIEISEKEKRIIEIMNLAYLLDQRTNYCVFVSFRAHVGWLDIEVRRSKESYNDHFLDINIFTDDRYSEEEVEECYERLLSFFPSK